MEVILLQDIDTLGYKNDIVKVRDGYGRNYLIPKKYAIIASESNRKQLAENLRQQARKIAQALADAQALAAQLEKQTLTFALKANEDGKLFGTVTAQMVADELEKQGISVDRRIITVEPIKQVGEGEAVLRLHREVKATVKLHIVKEED